MSVRFGQTLFGGSAFGLVAAAGLALCMASAQGSAVITKRAVPAAVVAEATVQADPRRSVFSRGKLASCIAHAHGNAAALYAGYGNAFADAEVFGSSQVEFSSYGWVNAKASFVSKPVRLAKCRTNAARGFAFGEAKALVAQIAGGMPAVGRARAFGTTYFVGNGHAQAHASLDGMASYIFGGAGKATGSAEVQAEGRFQIGVSGEAVATVAVSGEPAITKKGVRYFTGYGEAVCLSDAYAGTVGIHQAQTGKAVAELFGRAWYRLGGAGHARAYATLQADPLAASTAATAIGGSCKADASASVKALFSGKGRAVARATGYGNALIKHTKAQAKVAATKATVTTGAAVVTNTKANPDDAYGVALATGRAIKKTLAFAHPIALAYMASGYGIKTLTGYAIGVGKAVVACQAIRTHFSSGHAQCAAEARNAWADIGVFPVPAQAVSDARMTALLRTHYGKGSVLATAQAVGMNQVNDLTRAPADRTIFVEAESRLITVEFEDRRIVV